MLCLLCVCVGCLCQLIHECGSIGCGFGKNKLAPSAAQVRGIGRDQQKKWQRATLKLPHNFHKVQTESNPAVVDYCLPGGRKLEVMTFAPKLGDHLCESPTVLCS